MTPRILIQCGSHELDNLGELAMLEVLIGRLEHVSPRPEIALFTRDVTRARMISADLEVIPVESTKPWRLISSKYLEVRKALPFVDASFRKFLPGVYSKSLRLKARQLANRAVLRDADFLILSGGGYITDVFPGTAWSVLERLGAAMDEGVPFALLGQGIGPLYEKELRAAAAKVLPAAELIAVREELSSVPLLETIGVDRERIHITGDDAIELAYRARKEERGAFLGFNVRVAGYAGIRVTDLRYLKSGLQGAAREIGTTLLPLPEVIGDSVESASDERIGAEILSGFAARSMAAPPVTTTALLERVSACKVVVTGSYHAAVFALSQGIPAIGIFHSGYYEQKFRGLAGQFGMGCVVLDYSAPGFESSLHDAIIDCWCAADALRDSLLAAAQAQIRAGRATFQRVVDEFVASESAAKIGMNAPA